MLMSKDERLARVEGNIANIKKILHGNGKKGLMDEVRENRDFRIRQETMNKMIAYGVGSGWFSTIVLAIVMLVN